MNDWLRGAAETVAGETGVDPGTLDLEGGDARILLEIARIAAHRSGERTNAPLLCYLIGHAAARGEAADLAVLLEALKGYAGEDAAE